MLKKILSVVIILVISTNLITVFADGLKEEGNDLMINKSNYKVNNDGTISARNIINYDDTYIKAINLLVNIGAVKVNSDYTVTDYYNPNVYNKTLINQKELLLKNIDYNKLFQECVNKNGEFYGILPKHELEKIENYVGDTVPRVRSEIFDYYQEVLKNTVLLSYTYNSYCKVMAEPLAYYESGLFFVDKVRSNGDWDYKAFLGVNTRYYCSMKTYEELYTGESIGNMNYGTVGSYLFDSTILKSAAGLYQIYSGTAKLSWFKSYFDDPSDQRDIEKGISLHSEFGFPSLVN